MGNLKNFLGAFAGHLGDQYAEKRKIEQAEEAAVQAQKRQLDYLRAAEALRARNDAAVNPPQTRAKGAPAMRDGRYFQAMETWSNKYDAAGNPIAGAWEPAEETEVVAPAPLRVKAGETLYRPDGSVIIQGEETELNKARTAAAWAKARGGGSGSSRAPRGEDGLTAAERADDKRADKNLERLERQGSNGAKETDPSLLAGRTDLSEKRLTERLEALSDTNLAGVKAAAVAIGFPMPAVPAADEYGWADDKMDPDEYLDFAKEKVAEAIQQRVASRQQPAQSKVNYAAEAAKVKAQNPDATPAEIENYLAGKGIRK